MKLRKKELHDLHSSANINGLKMEYVACMYRGQRTFIKLCSAQLKEKRFGGRKLQKSEGRVSNQSLTRTVMEFKFPNILGNLSNWYFKYLLTQTVGRNLWRKKKVPYSAEFNTHTFEWKDIKQKICQKILQAALLPSAFTCCQIMKSVTLVKTGSNCLYETSQVLQIRHFCRSFSVR